MSAARYRPIPDSCSIDIAFMPKNIIDYDVLYATESLEEEIEKEAINFNENVADTKCIVNFFKLSFCIMQKYKNVTLGYDVVKMYGMHQICLLISILYQDCQRIFKSCVTEHPNVLDARKCPTCMRRFSHSSIATMKLINSSEWRPSLNFGIALAYLFHFYNGSWYDCAWCLPRQEAEIDNFSD